MKFAGSGCGEGSSCIDMEKPPKYISYLNTTTSCNGTAQGRDGEGSKGCGLLSNQETKLERGKGSAIEGGTA